MGRLVPYHAAMQRVLKGLEAQDEIACFDSDSEDGGGSQEDKEERAALKSRLAFLASDFSRATGSPISPEELKDKCKGPAGEFYMLREEVTDAVCRYCERSQDWDALECLENGEIDEALEAAGARAAAGLSSAELRKAKTLPMIILKVAHRRATRLRAASGRAR